MIGMYLVVLAHTYLLPNGVHNFIFAFHVPMFFFLCGLVDKHEKAMRDVVIGSFWNLIIPYLVYSGIYLIYRTVFLTYTTGFDIHIFCSYLMGIILGNGYHTVISRSPFVPGWFLIGLFFTKIFFVTCKNRKAIVLFSLLSILVAYVLKLFSIDLWWSIDCAILVFSIFLPFVTVANKYAPILLGKTKASRKEV